VTGALPVRPPLGSDPATSSPTTDDDTVTEAAPRHLKLVASAGRITAAASRAASMARHPSATRE